MKPGELYYITIFKFNEIEKENEIVFCAPLRLTSDKNAIDFMNRLIDIWCDKTQMDKYNINLYKMKWINGV